MSEEILEDVEVLVGAYQKKQDICEQIELRTKDLCEEKKRIEDKIKEIEKEYPLDTVEEQISAMKDCILLKWEVNMNDTSSAIFEHLDVRLVRRKSVSVNVLNPDELAYRLDEIGAKDVVKTAFDKKKLRTILEVGFNTLEGLAELNVKHNLAVYDL